MLERRLSRARTLLPDIVAIGGTCDAYQPAEETYKNTQQCLEILLKYHYPVIISTKSTLILRDLDILCQITDDSWCTIGITITTYNEKLARFLEPGAPSPKDRLSTVKEIKKRHPKIQAGVNFIPIVPFLGDSEDNMKQVVTNTKKAGADFILFGGGMTLRDNQALFFLERLGGKFPHLVAKYKQLYQGVCTMEEGYQGKYEPQKSYLKQIQQKMFSLCHEHGLNFRLRRYIPDDFRKFNYLAAQKLLDDAYICQILGKPWRNTFWAGQNINNLGESITEIAKRGELKRIRNIAPSIEKLLTDFLNKW